MSCKLAFIENIRVARRERERERERGRERERERERDVRGAAIPRAVKSAQQDRSSRSSAVFSHEKFENHFPQRGAFATLPLPLPLPREGDRNEDRS